MSNTPSDALAKLRHLYANMIQGGVRDTASAKRIAEGLLAPAIELLERSEAPQPAMSNTPSDADVNDVVQQELNEYLNGAYADYSGAKDQLRCFARAVLAKWGAPQPVVREPLPQFQALKFHARRDKKATVTLLFQDAEVADAWVRGITQNGGTL